MFTELLLNNFCVDEPRINRHLTQLPITLWGDVEVACLANTVALESHKEYKMAVVTHTLCFDLPDIFRGRFVGCPCGIFSEHGKTLYVTDI